MPAIERPRAAASFTVASMVLSARLQRRSSGDGMKSSTCEGGGPLACLEDANGSVKTSAAQTAFATG